MPSAIPPSCDQTTNQIIVFGMHRSGTSLITRLINLLGAYVGAPDVMLPPSPDNPGGYWERWDVVAVNDALLATRGCTWDRVDEWNSCRPSSRLSKHARR